MAGCGYCGVGPEDECLPSCNAPKESDMARFEVEVSGKRLETLIATAAQRHVTPATLVQRWIDNTIDIIDALTAGESDSDGVNKSGMLPDDE